MKHEHPVKPGVCGVGGVGGGGGGLQGLVYTETTNMRPIARTKYSYCTKEIFRGLRGRTDSSR